MGKTLIIFDVSAVTVRSILSWIKGDFLKL